MACDKWSIKLVPCDYIDEYYNPLGENDYVKLHHFNRHWVDTRSPDEWEAYVNEQGEVTSSDVGVRRKLDCQTLIPLSCYQHGGAEFSLYGGGIQCRFDTAGFAGFIELDPKIYKPDERESAVAKLLEYYNDYLNGRVWDILVTPPGEDDGDLYGHRLATELWDEAREGELVNSLYVWGNDYVALPPQEDVDIDTGGF